MMLTLHTADSPTKISFNYHGAEEGVVSDFEASPFQVSVEAKNKFCLVGYMTRQEAEVLQASLSEAIREQDRVMIERTL